MPMFLLKTEPGEYSYDDLVKERRTTWAGVSNNTALQHLRRMTKGDRAFLYHTGDEKAIVGRVDVVKGPYQAPARAGVTPDGLPKFAVVDIKPGPRAVTPGTLAQIKADPAFASFDLVRQSRLSVMAVPDDLSTRLIKMLGLA